MVVVAHIFEVPTNVLIEEALYFGEIEFRIYKDSADISFDKIRQTL